jgi:hypothetical protein
MFEALKKNIEQEQEILKQIQEAETHKKTSPHDEEIEKRKKSLLHQLYVLNESVPTILQQLKEQDHQPNPMSEDQKVTPQKNQTNTNLAKVPLTTGDSFVTIDKKEKKEKKKTTPLPKKENHYGTQK